jgi:glutathione S-transferase
MSGFRPRLISHHLCPYVQRAVIALEEKRVEYERTSIDLADKPDWFLAISPTGKVPVLTIDGEVLFESSVIAEFIDEVTPGSLLPADPLQKAKQRAWIEFGSAILTDIAGFYGAPDAQAFEAKRSAIAGKFARLEGEVKGPFFAGEAFGLVDAAFGPVFRYLDTFDRIGDFGLLAGLPKVSAWRRALAERPSVKAAVAPDYGSRLAAFLAARGSYLSGLMRQAGLNAA